MFLKDLLEFVKQMRRGQAAHVTAVEQEAARRAEEMDRGLTKRVAADEVRRQAKALLNVGSIDHDR